MIELVPRGVTTVTSTVPLAGVGGVAKITVSLWTVKPGEAVAPKSTAVAPVKPQPQSVIGSFVKFWLGPAGAPIVGPWLGFIPVMRGTVRSEERRVGKECRSLGPPYPYMKKGV